MLSVSCSEKTTTLQYDQPMNNHEENSQVYKYNQIPELNKIYSHKLLSEMYSIQIEDVNDSIEEVIEDVLEEDEAEKIEEALLNNGYFNDSIPLSYEEQDYLRTACKEFNIPYALALAVVEHETDFRNIMGDNGNSYGYMQIQLKWHKDRMVRIGATDLNDPYDNFRTGCSLLSDLINKYGLKDALSCYNTGDPGPTQYANKVIEKMNKWKEIVNE